MSWHTGSNQDNKLFPKGKLSGSYAPLDIAFENSPAMNEFENRLCHNNPIISERSMSPAVSASYSNPEATSCGCMQTQTQPQHQTLSQHLPQTHHTDAHDQQKLSGIFYNRTTDAQNQFSETINPPPSYTVHNTDIRIPLNRQQQYPANHLGSELLEGYNNVGTEPCMGFWEILLLIILIAVLVYGIYWLYKSEK
ncbi:hypothetical protein [Acanthamoeba castellanii mimivirus]|jgi:hypothetical protein|uniref:Uncharacterized protein R710 n=5 Tax=Mimivirus TaxID=315393 RepID=YR710_MIMIV|nr:hypothetical protein MIMI_gp0768 [Acanthamoeba polyphaga mimivirus]Q5UQ56.1 RecName: Full=Uncharacterized protein R710 [Acanthamoeba polyphaga mimivirus]AHA45124.1 hypothetical protein HIRU_S218 [Hirudovirus strain Sangsue]AHJ40333.1 hypothetical protein [Samba virus]ALR84333.1 hypothetical protein [Niemeyer virus]AMZ03154.1 hypothetical protein [Mimivirus Bombay]BAV61841.1 hypothetical protein [Acanthamoeba castellanii mimivirus]